MPVYQQGSLNVTALTAPNLYIVINSPGQTYVNGIPTDGLGVVGVASWGPVNAATVVGSTPQAIAAFGPVTVRTHDLSTALAIASQVGCQNMIGVRVTDGTDTHATGTLMDTASTPLIGATLTATYTGVLGNTITAYVATGTAASTFKCVVQMAGYVAEVYDNLAGTGATLWANLVSAINNGQNGLRGPSQIVTASAGASVSAPNTTATVTLASGTDGATTITDSVLLGTDGLARTGVYALRGAGAQVAHMADATTGSTWAAQVALGLQEGIYFHLSNARNTTITASASALSTAGIDSYAATCLVGNWPLWNDTFNGQIRAVAPATFTAALQATTSPEQSVLNKSIPGVVALDRMSPFSSAEISLAATSRLEVLTLGAPAGNIFSCRTGRNTSSNAATNGDNYSRMTNYIAYTIASAFGNVIGQTQTALLRSQTKASLDAYFANLQANNMIGNVNQPTQAAWNVQINAANNPFSQVSQGYMMATIQVTYLSIVRYFVVELTAGQTVTVTAQ